MAEIERIFTIPLRRGTMLAPRTRRAKKAMFVMYEFLERHMKSKDISVSQALNEHLWSQGMRNPIMKVTVAATKNDKNKVHVRLATEKKDAKVEKKADKKADAKTESKPTEAPKKEAKTEAPKAAEKPAPAKK